MKILDAPQATQMATRIVDAASDKQASDILLIDIGKISILADYFVICSGTTSRQLEAISDAIQKTADSEGWRLHGKEGTTESGWILLDYGAVIVHLFSKEMREYYGLERLWQDAPTVTRIL